MIWNQKLCKQKDFRRKPLIYGEYERVVHREKSHSAKVQILVDDLQREHLNLVLDVIIGIFNLVQQSAAVVHFFYCGMTGVTQQNCVDYVVQGDEESSENVLPFVVHVFLDVRAHVVQTDGYRYENHPERYQELQTENFVDNFPRLRQLVMDRADYSQHPQFGGHGRC